jgi:hypothetical protein
MSEDLDDIVDNLREPSAWIRVLFMVGFALVLHLIVGPIIIVLMIVQALFKLITGETNFNLRRFGRALGQWVYEVIQFLTYNSKEKPFPFSDFPPLEDEEESGEGEGKESKSKKASSKTSGKNGDSARTAADNATKDESGDAKKEQGGETTGSSARKKPAAKKSASKKKSGNSAGKKKAAAKKSSSNNKADSKDASGDNSGDKTQDDKAGDDKSEA